MRVTVNRPENDVPLEFELPADSSVFALKDEINKHSGVPKEVQHLNYQGRELKNKQQLQYVLSHLVTAQPGAVSTATSEENSQSGKDFMNIASDNLALDLTYELSGSSCVECCGMFCVLKPFQCYFRTLCCNSGCDLRFNECQYFCWKCIFCPSDAQKHEA
ncbi:hypothetical protein SARC_11411 [Sphaeroforma arctica JP610]|uniref:Ubiquitin-like domain-containing protein n=1 Tax=Sphaeroforma arctica JP610 TaxID=667725 RepID=A0A0L0FI05_9EUKA|nr:hypothetical protein SARC_11411 [Sphaeroforma arctica JP610]KNC76076.1 hypothetical protein SARC_11411 [Sphaeroforma arctica JP610]|eukprot:XP_014149978.1 hypothetical protein SARC_11411 [Sphaeroforma arctica JP610]